MNELRNGDLNGHPNGEPNNPKSSNDTLSKVLACNAKNLMKKILFRRLFNAFNKWVRTTAEAKNSQDSSTKNSEADPASQARLKEFRKQTMERFLKNMIKRREQKKLLKKFLFWANFTKQGRSKEENESMAEDEKRKLEASSILVPLLAKICKSSIARNYGKGLIHIIQKKNSLAILKRLVEKTPFFNKYNLKKAFDRFRLKEEEAQGYSYKLLILKNLIRHHSSKNKNNVLLKRLRNWFSGVSSSAPASNSDIQLANAVDQLKRLLQKRYIKHPTNLFKDKVKDDNYDWAGRFALQIRRKVLTSTLREYIIRWRDNQLDSLLRDNMKKFYMKVLGRFADRFCKKIMLKKFQQWSGKTKLVGSAMSKSNIQTLVEKTKDYLKDKSADDKKALFDKIKESKSNKKYGVAMDIFIQNYFLRDRKKIAETFKNWRINTIKQSLEAMTYRLLARILNNMIKKNMNLNSKEFLEKYFNKWKKQHESKNRAQNQLRAFMDKVMASAIFNKLHVRDNIDYLLEFAKHFNLLQKKKAQKLGDFFAGILKVYERINLMKRQKTLMETFKKLDFLKRMQIIAALNRWKNRSSVVANNENANILQNFIRKIVGHESSKESLMQKVKLDLDNFAKKFGLHKLSEAAKLNRLYKLLMKLFDSIPKELRKRVLMEFMIRWNKIADDIKKNNAANTLIAGLKGYIGRMFAKKLLLLKYKREDMARRLFKNLVGQKLFYYSEWKRRARILALKQNAACMGVWMGDKFNGFKLLKSRRGLEELLNNYLKRRLLDGITAASKIDPHRNQKLVDAINKVYKNPPGRKLLKEVQRRYFKKRFGPVFGMIMRQLRHLHVYYYADHWRNKVMDHLNAKIIKLQSFIRMKLARLRAKRELRKQYLTAKIFRKLGLDGKMAVMLYINLWRAYNKYYVMNQEGEILAKLILFHNANVDYDKDVAQNNLAKLFKNFFVFKIKEAFISAKNYKNNVRDVAKSLNSIIEKQYSINNLVDYGRDSLRRMFLRLIFGINDGIQRKSLIAQAVERWRFFNAKLIEFVKRIQAVFRGKKIRDKMAKLWKVKDLFLRLLGDIFSDKDKKRARTIIWRNRAINLAATGRATLIQNFLKQAILGNARNTMNKLFNDGYRKHFLNCLAQCMRLKKLKDAMAKPWNRQTLETINKKAKMNKLADRFRMILGFSDANNRAWIKKQMMIKWNLQAMKLKEHEMFCALLIVASIRAKITKLKVQRFKELKSSIRYLLFKCFGAQADMKRYAATQWLNYVRAKIYSENRDKVVNHAKDILRKIKESKDQDRKAKYQRAKDLITKYIARLLLRGQFGDGLQNTRNNKLKHLDDIYRNVYRRNIAEGLRRIKYYAFYKDNLIKKLQRRWRYYRRFANFLKKLMMIKLMIKLALDKDLQKKHSHMIFWRNQVNQNNARKHGTILQDLYRDIMDHLRTKKGNSISNLKDLFRNYILKSKILQPLIELGKVQKMANIENIIRKSHLRYLDEKSLLLYILRLLCGFYNKCENKLKQSAIYKFRFNALGTRDKAAKGRLLNLAKELTRRRRQNKVRETMVRLVKGQNITPEDIKAKCIADWCRKAEACRIKEQIDIIGPYLLKQKKALDLKKKWAKLGIKLQNQNGIFGVRYMLDQANLLKKINPMVKCIYRRNTALNGDDLLNKLRHRVLLIWLKKKFLPLMLSKDDNDKIIHADHWNNQAQKLLKRDNLINKLGDHLQNKFNTGALNLVKSACRFRIYGKKAEIVQKHDFLRTLKAIKNNNLNQEGFANALVQAQAKIHKNSAVAFRDKIYKFFVYKILMNMGANFLKEQESYRLNFAREFFTKFNQQYAPYRTNSKNLVDKLGNIMQKHNNDINDKLNKVLSFLTLEKLFARNINQFVFDKLRDTFRQSKKKGTLYAILRLGFLKKKLSILEGANQFLKLNHLANLYANNFARRKIKKISKGFKEWKFKNNNLTILEEKQALIKNTMDKFSSSITTDLLTGKNGLIKQFANFQNTDIVKDSVLRRAETESSKKLAENQKDKYQKMMTQKSVNSDANKKVEDNKDSKDLRDTIKQGEKARTNLKN